jgi:two-component system, OmpR family, response regulator NblR
MVDQLTLNSALVLVFATPELGQQIATDLKQAGYEPVLGSAQEPPLAQLQTWQPALVMIDQDWQWEQQDPSFQDPSFQDPSFQDPGLHLCKALRAEGISLPLLLLLAEDTLADRIACLEAGADDYFAKPYRGQDCQRYLKLYLQPEQQVAEQLQFETLSLDLGTRQAKRNGRTIDLTMKEFELLRYLMEHPRQILNREQILDNVWGDDFSGESNVIEVYVRYLRLKVEQEGEKRLIHTVRGVGYVLREG